MYVCLVRSYLIFTVRHAKISLRQQVKMLLFFLFPRGISFASVSRRDEEASDLKGNNGIVDQHLCIDLFGSFLVLYRLLVSSSRRISPNCD